MYLQSAIQAFFWTQYVHFSCPRSLGTCPSFSSSTVIGFRFPFFFALSFLKSYYNSIIIIKVNFSAIMATFKGMRFCRECDNMLQPKEQKTEDSEFGRLIYDCRICGYFEKAKAGDEADHCVYRSSEQTQTGTNQAAGGGESGPKFFFQVDKECVKDPTLSRRKDLICRKCGHNEAVTFMNPTKDRMNLIFVCTKCTFYWRKEKAEGDPVYSDDEEDDQ